MAKVIVIGHGTYATSVETFLNMICGTTEGFSFIDFTKDDGIDSLTKKIETKMNELNTDDLLFVCDICGGSPFNESCKKVMENIKLEVVAGVNLASIADAAFTLKDLSAKEVAINMVESTKKSVARLEK